MKEQFKDFTDEKIALLAQDGDRGAEHFLLEKYRNFVRSKSYSYFIIGGDSDDLLQEGLIGLYKGIHSFKEKEKTSFRNFASLCIKRQIITAIRSANCQKNQLLNTSLSFSQKVSDESEMTFEEMLGVDNSMNPEDIILGKEQANLIEKTIKNELSLLEWTVFLGYMNGEKFSKMARKLDLPIKSVYNAIDRSRKKIMKSLKGEKT
ncbi:hypothetical protein AZF37_07740 [endosymbiont 'TC1' of Trimyema compressum]|uniref:sigma-70 family RNA polymerase sigma factor n=1 Tax=endosymbiont 'TC1' of Trimyema compressum TaxID=243899 RepID=UPI0007F18566|nr:sigma-70 family RNA polymerase sigma factor [endosymbiont 'TC1' of Trimyema compressum]AMP21071.1 hypothetical protein AZF37_07740 [endosymbiont 'TC1' of Trimyema compressum]